MLALARLQPGSSSVSEAAFALARELPRGSVVFCLSLSVSRALAETLDVLVHQGLKVRWFCAERDAFTVAGGRSSESGSAGREARSPAGTVLAAAQLHPGMRLDEAFA